MMTSGITAAPKPTPDPGRSRNHRNASHREIPAMIIANSQPHGRSDQRAPRPESPERAGARNLRDPAGDRKPAPQSRLLELRDVPEDPEPVETEQPESQVQPVEPREGSEEAKHGYQDRRVTHSFPPCARIVGHAGPGRSPSSAPWAPGRHRRARTTGNIVPMLSRGGSRPRRLSSPALDERPKSRSCVGGLEARQLGGLLAARRRVEVALERSHAPDEVR